jgi:hypothetical protein
MGEEAVVINALVGNFAASEPIDCLNNLYNVSSIIISCPIIVAI